MLKRFRIVGLCLVAVFAVSAVGAVAAQAEGPNWIGKNWCIKAKPAGTGHWKRRAASTFKCEEEDSTGKSEWEKFTGVLPAGEEAPIKSKNIGNFELVTPNSTITCTGETNTGELIGGEPGTDTATVTFTGCKDTRGAGNGCTASASSSKPGEIGPVEVLTFLVYPEGKYKGTAEAYDAFVAKNGNLFAEFKLEGGLCSLIGTIKVEATGTQIRDSGETSTEPVVKKPPTWNNKKCGVLAHVGEINAMNAFKATASGVIGAKGGLQFPSPPLTKAEVETTSKTAKKITCALEATIVGTKEKAEQLGVTEVTPNSGEEFGWEV